MSYLVKQIGELTIEEIMYYCVEHFNNAKTNNVYVEHSENIKDIYNCIIQIESEDVNVKMIIGSDDHFKQFKASLNNLLPGQQKWLSSYPFMTDNNSKHVIFCGNYFKLNNTVSFQHYVKYYCRILDILTEEEFLAKEILE